MLFSSFRNKKHSKQGVLFVATGLPYLQEATESARASRAFIGNRHIAIVTDLVKQAQESGAFDFVFPHPAPVGGYRDKIYPLLSLPFANTLFLDTDARLTFCADAVFSSLGRAHFAAAHAPVRLPNGWCDNQVPLLFPEFNSGVLLLRRSSAQRRLIRSWLELYDSLHETHGQMWDQASLRSIVWNLQTSIGFRYALLPPEANLRTTKPWIAGKGLNVYIVHGRVPQCEWDSLLLYLNGDISRFRHWSEWLDHHPLSSVRPKLPPNPVL